MAKVRELHEVFEAWKNNPQYQRTADEMLQHGMSQPWIDNILRSAMRVGYIEHIKNK